MLDFQEQKLENTLDTLPPQLRVAFAAACAQRLSNACQRYLMLTDQTDRLAAYSNVLDFVWNSILHPPASATAERLLADVMEWIPDQDDPGWTPLTAYAEDGLSALAYCLYCLMSTDVKKAIYAAQCIYDAVDCCVNLQDETSPQDAQAEKRILGHAIIQAELARQARDLADLQTASPTLSPAWIQAFRQRSNNEQAIAIP